MLTKSINSVSSLDGGGYHTSFSIQHWKIQKGSLVLARGAKFGTLYPLHVSNVVDHVVAIIEQASASLRHGQLGHMSKNGMEILSSSGYIPCLSLANFDLCEHCVYGNKHAKSAHKRNL